MDNLLNIQQSDSGQEVAARINGNFGTVKESVENIEYPLLDASRQDEEITFSRESSSIVNGNKQSSLLCKLSSPIKVFKGDIISLHCGNYYDCAILSATDEGGTTYTPLIMGEGSVSSIPAKDYSYTIESNGYIVIGWYASSGIEVSISRMRSEVVKDIESRLDSHDKVFGRPSIYLSGDTGDTDLSGKTVDELYAAYDALCTAYPQMIVKDTDLGTDATDTYAIRQYTISMNSPYQINGEYFGTTLPETNAWDDDYNVKKVIGIATGCHGNEKNVTWGVYLAIKELVESSEQWAMYIKSNFIIKLLPCINPYGHQNVTRNNGNDKDINRDINAQTQSESVAWKKFIDDNKENMVLYLDMHGTDGRCGYFEALATDIYFEEYCRAYYKFISAIYADYMTYMGADAYPFVFLCRSTYTGTTMDYVSSLGIKGHIMETTHAYNLAVLSSKWCKMTKDELINGIMLYAVP